MADKWKKEWTKGTSEIPKHLKTQDKDEPRLKKIRNK